MRYRVLPYRQGSKGAKSLAEALGGKVLKLKESKFKPKPSDLIINWGNTDVNCVHWGTAYPHTIRNLPNQIRNASNKLFFFKSMVAQDKADIVPRFWENKNDIPDDAFPIVCRTELAGHSGAGIVIAESRDNLVHAPLYVEYVKKEDEYRVHVGRKAGASIIIAVQRKARRIDVPDEQVNWQVRNHCNGFVFVRQGVNPPTCVLERATDALECSGLDFGAVDVIYNVKKDKAYVLEINTAPGIEGSTVQDYVKFFKTP